jgi:excisionase family DNA binding protein
MPKQSPRKRLLLDGRSVDLGGLDARRRAFLADLEKMRRQGVSYFEIYRAALGPGSPALEGRARVDRKLAGSPLYLAAQDISTRAGIEQGLILAPEHAGARAEAPADGSMISVTQAAALIGITRAAVYKAIERNALRAMRIGNVTIVDRKAALAYKRHRDGEGATARPAE